MDKGELLPLNKRKIKYLKWLIINYLKPKISTKIKHQFKI